MFMKRDISVKLARCKAFGTNYILKRHMKVHSKEKEFPCSSCNSTFTLKANLRRHEKNRMNVM